MQKRSGEPWISPAEYGRSLRGLSVNLLVREIEAALVFQRQVLDCIVLYSDPDFAVVRGAGSEWMLHADHVYAKHPIGESVGLVIRRGAGVELRLHGIDPDRAEARARELGYHVLAGAHDTAHGLREAYLVDSDGYVWVLDVHLKG